ncbi:VIT1/CCC1 transporter family protein [Canibacter zhoujuaniae]|uniref:VIT1/CCC1 transporter family protein n=1 Tax=Canibacter zhoujuaniae TaxID=2708343 RepID=UPI001FB9826B|nr:VIT1/CCC1 transporter family protein [Canibacter zhoujuaniae]
MATTEVNLANPHEYDHKHANIQNGWLRAAVFGAMDGLVSNIGLIAGIAAAGAAPHVVLVTGTAGLLAGSVSMALGEYTSVRAANEQLDKEVAVEAAALKRNPTGEEMELAQEFVGLGMSAQTAQIAAKEVHRNQDKALQVHLAHELGLTVEDRNSPWVAAFSSFFSFSAGAIIPILPYIFGFGTLVWGLILGAIGLCVTGAFSAHFAKRNLFRGALRQLLLGGIAVGVTYAIGMIFDVSTAG